MAGKDLPHARKINEKVCESGCNFGPSFGTSFGPRFGPYKYDLKELAPKLEPKLGPKPGPKIATNFANFFTHFSGMQQIFARYGVARVLQLSHFFCVRPCLRSATADHVKLPVSSNRRVSRWELIFGASWACSGLYFGPLSCALLEYRFYIGVMLGHSDGR